MLIKDAQFETVSDARDSQFVFCDKGDNFLHFQTVTFTIVFQDCRIFLNEYNASIPNQL